jgi:hypothetical protein
MADKDFQKQTPMPVDVLSLYEVDESDIFYLVVAAVGDALKDRPDQINREFLQLQVSMVPAEGRDYRLVGS